jgi:hypothetical protein
MPSSDPRIDVNSWEDDLSLVVVRTAASVVRICAARCG